jgi:peptide-methionine (S)-S-oxide reductase
MHNLSDKKSIFNLYTIYMEDKKLETATLAGGCFWCTEAVFERLKGVEEVVSGYSGGQMENPSYEEVSAEKTGHAEAIQITFDPAQISYKEILDVFFATHDPTTLDRQGNDVGEQYRSVIFYENEGQRKIAEDTKDALQRSGKFEDEIITSIEPFKNFYPAEDYHQKFYDHNSGAPYCSLIIDPKIKKLYKEFPEKVKK